MKKILFGCLLVVCSCSVVKVTEKEPNSDFNHATEIKLKKKAEVSGFLKDKNDVDFYKVTIPVTSEGGESVEKNLSISLVPAAGIDMAFAVFNARYDFIKGVNDFSVGEKENLINMGVKEGDVCFLQLKGIFSAKAVVKSTSEYKMLLEIKDGLNTENEPNDKRVKAANLQLNREVEGFFNPQRIWCPDGSSRVEEDWYRIEVGKGDSILDFDISGVPFVDSVMTIYDENDYKLVEIDNYGEGQGESYHYLGVKGPAYYTLAIRGKNNSGSFTVPYKLRTNFRQYKGVSEKEPNDNRSIASGIATKIIGDPGNMISGYINPAGDKDWYRIRLTGRKNIMHVKAESAENLDIVMKVCDGMGEVLKTVNNMGREATETLSNMGILPDKTYYLVIADNTGKNANSRDPYKTTITFNQYDKGQEFEPNDKTADAELLEVGSKVSGYLAPRGDVDCFKLNVYSEVSLKFSVTGIPGIRIALEMLYPDGQTKVLTSDEPGLMLEGVFKLPAGKDCVLKLKGADLRESNVRDEYTLTVSQE